MRRAIVWLFHLLLLTVPFAFSAATDELFEFNKMILTYGFTVCILILWLLRMIREKRPIFSHTRFDLFLGLFLLSQLISTFFSLDLHTSIFGYYSRFHGGLLSTLSYLLLYFAAVSNIKKEELPSLIRTLLFAGIGVALYAFPEHFGLSPSCVLITGIWGVSCWVQDVQTRVFGTFGQPNWLAAYLLTLIPLAMWWISEHLRTRTLPRSTQLPSLVPLLWPGLGLLLMLFTLLYTGSRSGFGGLVLGLGIFFATSAWRWLSPRLQIQKSSQKLRERNWLLIPSILIVATGVLFLLHGTPFTPGISSLFQTTAPPSPSTEVLPSSSETPSPARSTVLENGGTDSGKIRKIVWEGALQVWKRYPLFGSGVETFAYSYYRDRPIEHNYVSEWDFLYNKAHNEYLNFLATTGIFGLGSVLLLMGAFVFFSVRAVISRQTKAELALFASALASGYIGLAFSNFLGFSTVAVALLFFLWPAFLEIAEKDPAQVSALESSKKSSSRSEEFEITLDFSTLLSGATLLLGLILLLWIYGMWNNDRILAQSKRLLSGGQAIAAYQLLHTLTQRAPTQAEYWEEKGIVLSQLAVSSAQTEASSTSASLTDDLIQEATAALDASIEVNPAHINMWKSRARGYIWLGTLDSRYLQEAITSLLEAQKLAPTDPKITYNLALLYESVKQDDKADEYYRKTIELRSIYEQARKSYAEFLVRSGRYQEALDQYRYLNDVLKPTENLFSEEIAALEASMSAQQP